jgi:hypothetical protein
MPHPPVRQIPEGREVAIRHGFIDEQQPLTEERRQAVAAAYDDVLAEARREAKKLVKDARPTVEKLTAVMAELGELLGAVKTCRTPKNAEATDGHRQFHDERLTVERFVALAAAGGDPTGILDLAGGGKAQPLQVQAPSNTGMVWSDIEQLLGSGQRGA